MKGKKIRQFIILILMFLLVLSVTIKTYAVTPTLEEIAEAFNNSTIVTEYPQVTWNASVNENVLTASYTYNEETRSVEFVLDGNILSTAFTEENGLDSAVISIYVIDSICKLHGYEYGEIMPTLNADEITHYTLENEGLELKENEETGEYTIRIDISKKIPLVDFSETYIEVSDLEIMKDIISQYAD